MLRNPAKYREQAKQKAQALANQAIAQADASNKVKDSFLIAVGVGIAVLALVLVMVVLSAKNRAENLSAAVDPAQVKGLTVADKVFNPASKITYIQIQEGQDRNVAARELGSTLPIISRFNFQRLTPKNYEVIGAAPWALTINFESNLNDPDLMRYLLDNEAMINAFLSRADDVEPLTNDPQLLAAFAGDEAMLQSFFSDEVVQAVLANEKMVRQVAGSRFMSHLLTSKSGKYFREHPQEALAIIRQSPSLQALQQNANVRKAVQENPYLKKMATTLLGPVKTAQTPAKPAAKTTAKKTTSPAAKKTKK